MARAKSEKAAQDPADPAEAPKVEDADDGGTSRRTAGYEDNPDAPAGSIAQVEVLKDEEDEG